MNATERASIRVRRPAEGKRAELSIWIHEIPPKAGAAGQMTALDKVIALHEPGYTPKRKRRAAEAVRARSSPGGRNQRAAIGLETSDEGGLLAREADTALGRLFKIFSISLPFLQPVF